MSDVKVTEVKSKAIAEDSVETKEIEFKPTDAQTVQALLLLLGSQRSMESTPEVVPIGGIGLGRGTGLVGGGGGVAQKPPDDERKIMTDVLHTLKNIENIFKNAGEDLRNTDEGKELESKLTDLKSTVSTIDSDGDGVPDVLDKDRDTSTAKLSEDLYNIKSFIHENTAFFNKYVAIQGLAKLIQNALDLINSIASSSMAHKPQGQESGSSPGGGSKDDDSLFSKKKTDSE
jgi:hypothetical protein